jgi:hypothetical protein
LNGRRFTDRTACAIASQLPIRSRLLNPDIASGCIDTRPLLPIAVTLGKKGKQRPMQSAGLAPRGDMTGQWLIQERRG